MAAPIGGQVLGEVLPYLNVAKTTDLTEEQKEVEVPNVEGMTVKEAREKLKEKNLTMEIEESNTDFQSENLEEKLILSQFPKEGIKILEGKAIRVEI